ncbi:MAG TPA: type II secretion system protein [Opitutaceae bacterium]|nr:type II secretion system protein [Opitutaceae bacterium]
MPTRSKKGFTLVEIMIVVVIIGLLAAMAIPAFQKVRRSSIGKAMANDARQIGAAMQQIALEYPSDSANGSTFTITVQPDGSLESPLTGNIPVNKITEYVKKVSRGTSNTVYTFGGNGGTPAGAFNLTHGQCAPTDVIATSTTNVSTSVGQPVWFDEEGKAL